MDVAEEVRKLVEDGQLILTEHAMQRMVQRWNRGHKSTREQIRNAIHMMLMNAEIVEDSSDPPGVFRMRRNGVDCLLGLDMDRPSGARLVIITIFRRGGGPMPNCAFH